MFDPVAFRHALHRVPELAYKEHQTQALLLAQIKKLTQDKPAFEYVVFEDVTGILLFYHGAAGDMPYSLCRADMDALPIRENTSVDYISENEGVMHACGHDIHMSVLMGLIARVADELPRKNIIFLFQPGEEGAGGAQRIIAKGVLQKYHISSAFALHSGSGMDVSVVSSKPGIFFGIPQEFNLRFIGKSSHVAFPEYGINALACAAEFLVKMKDESAQLASKERLIFHVGKITGGSVRNSIADNCLMEGTHRTLSKAMKEELTGLMERVATEVAQKYGAEYELKLLGSYDPVINDAALYDQLKQICDRLGYTFVEAETVMTGEDFGFFSGLYPSLLFWLGGGCNYPLHSEKYLPSDESIAVGINVFWELLNR